MFQTVEDPGRTKANRVKLWTLKASLAFFSVLGDSECKTIGNGNPDGLHCFTCTFNDIRHRIERAIKFWEKCDQYKQALS